MAYIGNFAEWLQKPEIRVKTIFFMVVASWRHLQAKHFAQWSTQAPILGNLCRSGSITA